MEEIRWHQRFENYNKAFLRFTMAHDAYGADKLNPLFQMALIQSFEFTFELSWKIIKDYLKFNGIDLKLPREVIKEAFSSSIIKEGQLWIDMMEDRNATSHTYDDDRAKNITEKIFNIYWGLLKELKEFFDGKK